MNKKPLIGIIMSYLRPLIPEELAHVIVTNLNIDLLLFSPREINWSKKTISGLFFKNGNWEIKTLPFPLVIYNRRYSSKYYMANKLEKVIGQGMVFNHITKFNKWLIYKILKDSKVNIFLPDTFLY